MRLQKDNERLNLVTPIILNNPPVHKVNEAVTPTHAEPQPPTSTKARGKRKEVAQVGPSRLLCMVILIVRPAP